MKTPEEIKKGLEVCTRDANEMLRECEGCPYYIENNFLCGISNMQKDALAYIEQLEERIAKRDDYIQKLEDNQLKWISVRDQLPQDGQKIVMINAKYPSITLQGIYQADKTPDTIRVLGFGIGKVTHWMPTPEPPKEG